MGDANLVTHGCHFGLANLRLSSTGRVKPTAGDMLRAGGGEFGPAALSVSSRVDCDTSDHSCEALRHFLNSL